MERQFVTLREIKRWNDQRFRVEQVGPQASLLLVGEEHNNELLRKKHFELIRLLKPEVVINESLRAWAYIPGKGYERKPSRKFHATLDLDSPAHEDVEFLTLAEELGIRLEGCDLTEAELYETIMKYKDPSFSFKSLDENGDIIDEIKLLRLGDLLNPVIQERRERLMIEEITAAVGTTSRILIAILGSQHARNLYRRGLQFPNIPGYIFIDIPSPLDRHDLPDSIKKIIKTRKNQALRYQNPIS